MDALPPLDFARLWHATLLSRRRAYIEEVRFLKRVMSQFREQDRMHASRLIDATMQFIRTVEDLTGCRVWDGV